MLREARKQTTHWVLNKIQQEITETVRLHAGWGQRQTISSLTCMKRNVELWRQISPPWEHESWLGEFSNVGTSSGGAGQHVAVTSSKRHDAAVIIYHVRPSVWTPNRVQQFKHSFVCSICRYYLYWLTRQTAESRKPGCRKRGRPPGGLIWRDRGWD